MVGDFFSISDFSKVCLTTTTVEVVLDVIYTNIVSIYSVAILDGNYFSILDIAVIIHFHVFDFFI